MTGSGTRAPVSLCGPAHTLFHIYRHACTGRRNERALQGTLKWSAIAHALVDVLRGLACLHELKVIHGDIKAANVMLKSQPRDVSPVKFTAKLADLGLAQLRSHAVRPSLHTRRAPLPRAANEFYRLK